MPEKKRDGKNWEIRRTTTQKSYANLIFYVLKYISGMLGYSEVFSSEIILRR